MRLPSIVAALLTLAVLPAGAQETTSSVLDGVFTDTQAERGMALFAQKCAYCHGASLGGVGEAPALVGLQFISDFSGLTVGDLFDRVRATMPLNDPGSLGGDQYADILAFVLKSNGYPAGQRELYRRSEYLHAIRFDPPRP